MEKNKILPTVLQDHRKQQKHSAKITGVQVGHKNQKLANITKVQNIPATATTGKKKIK